MNDSAPPCHQIAFSVLDDHCTYNPERVFASFSQHDLVTLRSIFDGELPCLETTGDFYNVTQELDDQGHAELATQVALWNHDERLYECGCYNRAVDALILQVEQVATSIAAAHPTAVHLFNDRLLWGLDEMALLEDIEASLRSRTCEYIELVLDERGEGTRTVDGVATPVRCFLGTRAQYVALLADGEILDFPETEPNPLSGDDYVSTEPQVVELHEWLDLPAPVADLMAAIRQQDSWVCDEISSEEFSGLHGTDLMFSQLRTIAETTVSQLNDAELTAVHRLLRTTRVPILDAVQAVLG